MTVNTITIVLNVNKSSVHGSVTTIQQCTIMQKIHFSPPEVIFYSYQISSNIRVRMLPKTKLLHGINVCLKHTL